MTLPPPSLGPPPSPLHQDPGAPRDRGSWFTWALIFILLVAGAIGIWKYCERMEEAPVVSAGQPRVSPDGHWVAYATQEFQLPAPLPTPPAGVPPGLPVYTLPGVMEGPPGPWTVWLQKIGATQRKPIMTGPGDEDVVVEGWDRKGRWLTVVRSKGNSRSWTATFFGPGGVADHTVDSGSSPIMFSHQVGPWVLGISRAGRGPITFWRVEQGKPPRRIAALGNTVQSVRVDEVSDDDRLVSLITYEPPPAMSRVVILDTTAGKLIPTPYRGPYDALSGFWAPGGLDLFVSIPLLGATRIFQYHLADGASTDITPSNLASGAVVGQVDAGPVVHVMTSTPPFRIWMYAPGRPLTDEFSSPLDGLDVQAFESWGPPAGVVFSHSFNTRIPSPTFGRGSMYSHVYWYDYKNRKATRLDPKSPRERYEASALSRLYRNLRSHWSHPPPSSSPYPGPIP